MPILAHGVHLHYGQRTVININIFSVHCPLFNIHCHVSYQSIHAITVLCASLSLLGFPSLYVLIVSPKQCLCALKNVSQGDFIIKHGCSFTHFRKIALTKGCFCWVLAVRFISMSMSVLCYCWINSQTETKNRSWIYKAFLT